MSRCNVSRAGRPRESQCRDWQGGAWGCHRERSPQHGTLFKKCIRVPCKRVPVSCCGLSRSLSVFNFSWLLNTNSIVQLNKVRCARPHTRISAAAPAGSGLTGGMPQVVSGLQRHTADDENSSRFHSQHTTDVHRKADGKLVLVQRLQLLGRDRTMIRGP